MLVETTMGAQIAWYAERLGVKQQDLQRYARWIRNEKLHSGYNGGTSCLQHCSRRAACGKHDTDGAAPAGRFCSGRFCCRRRHRRYEQRLEGFGCDDFWLSEGCLECSSTRGGQSPVAGDLPIRVLQDPQRL